MTENMKPTGDSNKIELLKLIREHRTTIFGKFSASLSNKQKSDVWKTITNKAISLGLITAGRDSKYVRDVYWQNIRRRTMKKLDESRATGAAGGKEMALDDVDNLVIDIIGRDSNVMTGLKIDESSGTSEVESLAVKSPENLVLSEIETNSTSFNITNDNDGDFNDNDIEFIEVVDEEESSESKATLQMELLRQQIEYTKRDKYYRELAILEKERSLSLSPEERSRLLENSQKKFNQRNSI